MSVESVFFSWLSGSPFGVSQDLTALTIQAVGGGMAASATENNKDPTMGGHIMLGGIFFQIGVYYPDQAPMFTQAW